MRASGDNARGLQGIHDMRIKTLHRVRAWFVRSCGHSAPFDLVGQGCKANRSLLKANSDDAPRFASLFLQVRTEETFSAGPNRLLPGGRQNGSNRPTPD